MPAQLHTSSPESDGTRQVRDSILYMLPLVLGNLLPFATLPILTRILSTEDYGVLALAQVYAAVVSGLANFGMTIAYDRNYFQYRQDTRTAAALLFSSMAFVAAMSVACLLTTFFFRAPLAEWIIGAVGHDELLVVALAASCMIFVNQLFFVHLRNSENARAYVGYTLAGNLMTVALSLYLVAIARTGVIGLVWGPLISQACIFAALSWRFLRTMNLSFDRPLLTESLKLSYPLIPRIFLGTIDNQFDKYMIGLFGTLGGVGVYRIGQQVATLVFSYMTQLENVFLPRVYRSMFDDPQQGGKVAGRTLTPFAYVSIAVAMIVALFSEEVIALLTPPSFHGAADIVAVLSIYCGFLFFGKIIGTQLLFMKKSFLTSAMGIAGLALNIALCIPLIQLWGAIGAAWAVLLANLLSRGIFFLIAQRLYEIHWEYAKIAAIYGVFIGSALLVLFLRHGDATYVQRLIFKLLAMISYGYLGVRIGILTIENWNMLKTLATSREAWKTGREAA